MQQQQKFTEDELVAFLEKKMARLSKGIIIGFPFVFEDPARTFRIEFINVIGEEDGGVSLRIYYTVIRHGNDDFIIMRESCDGVAGVASAIRRAINDFVICRNCLHIRDPATSCERCMPYRVHNPPYSGDACAICLEEACYFRLSCSHAFHRLCLIRMNPFDTFTKFVHTIIRDKLRCPVCRTPFDTPDLCRIYDIQPDILLN